MKKCNCNHILALLLQNGNCFGLRTFCTVLPNNYYVLSPLLQNVNCFWIANCQNITFQHLSYRMGIISGLQTSCSAFEHSSAKILHFSTFTTEQELFLDCKLLLFFCVRAWVCQNITFDRIYYRMRIIFGLQTAKILHFSTFTTEWELFWIANFLHSSPK